MTMRMSTLCSTFDSGSDKAASRCRQFAGPRSGSSRPSALSDRTTKPNSLSRSRRSQRLCRSVKTPSTKAVLSVLGVSAVPHKTRKHTAVLCGLWLFAIESMFTIRMAVLSVLGVSAVPHKTRKHTAVLCGLWLFAIESMFTIRMAVLSVLGVSAVQPNKESTRHATGNHS